MLTAITTTYLDVVDFLDGCLGVNGSAAYAVNAIRDQFKIGDIGEPQGTHRPVYKVAQFHKHSFTHRRRLVQNIGGGARSG